MKSEKKGRSKSVPRELIKESKSGGNQGKAKRLVLIEIAVS